MERDVKKTKIKICGIRDVDTAKFCAAEGVDFLGIHQIWSPKNSEDICLFNKNIRLFNEIKSAVGSSTKLVLVTRESNLDNLLNICLTFDFADYIQMHFPISTVMLQNFKNMLVKKDCNVGIIAVIRADEIDTTDIRGISNEADYLLFDSSYHGGTGICLPDDMLSKITLKAGGLDYFLAGGLTPENVSSKILSSCPFAVDVQSGVNKDNEKYVKDHKKIQRFVQAVKETMNL
ncbi:MAG: phosphoribosylanthranilate isomerase [Candidatus Bathyarchaeota archaeon]|nr:phosphoribosylanthranilate isomerase [Candidatus Termiticorpusculum sp.]